MLDIQMQMNVLENEMHEAIKDAVQIFEENVEEYDDWLSNEDDIILYKICAILPTLRIIALTKVAFHLASEMGNIEGLDSHANVLRRSLIMAIEDEYKKETGNRIRNNANSEIIDELLENGMYHRRYCNNPSYPSNTVMVFRNVVETIDRKIMVWLSENMKKCDKNEVESFLYHIVGIVTEPINTMTLKALVHFEVPYSKVEEFMIKILGIEEFDNSSVNAVHRAHHVIQGGENT